MAHLIIVPNSVVPGSNGNTGKAVITGMALEGDTFVQIGWECPVDFTDTVGDINQAIIDAVKAQCVLLSIPIDEPGDVIHVFGSLNG